jgi:hypothetical protein
MSNRHAHDDRRDRGIFVRDAEFCFYLVNIQGGNGRADHTTAQSDGAGRQHQVLRRQPAVGGYELAGRLGADDDEGTRSLPVLLLVALLL